MNKIPLKLKYKQLSLEEYISLPQYISYKKVDFGDEEHEKPFLPIFHKIVYIRAREWVNEMMSIFKYREDK